VTTTTIHDDENADTVTDEQIMALREQAWDAQDYLLAAVCTMAMRSCDDARAMCASEINSARADGPR
jgi:hypothetical protein